MMNCVRQASGVLTAMRAVEGENTGFKHLNGVWDERVCPFGLLSAESRRNLPETWARELSDQRPHPRQRLGLGSSVTGWKLGLLRLDDDSSELLWRVL
ncbi:hypothetical protein Ancab_000391 [Ancistrocladus abbreviatus]